MTPDEQCVAIHVAIGRCRKEDVFYVTGVGHVYAVKNEGFMLERKIPRYYWDLNAMHEAEKYLRADPATGNGGWSDYGTNLQMICDFARKPKYHATSAQRAEAFLRTIGKWEEPNSKTN